MQANRIHGADIAVPSQHLPTIRHAAVRLTAIAAENLYRRIDYNGSDDYGDLSLSTAKGRLDDFWSLFAALDGQDDDVTLPAAHAWAIREAIDCHAEDLRDRPKVDCLDNDELIALGRELEALLAYREQVDPLAGCPDAETA